MKKPKFNRNKTNFRKNILSTAISLCLPFSLNAVNFNVTQENDDGTGNAVGSLSHAISQANNTPEDDTIILTTDVTLSGIMKRLISSNITIQSDSTRRTINGNNLYRPLFIKSGVVSIQNLNIINGNAIGGSNTLGGGGAGMGGSIFVYDGQVTIDNISIDNSIAQSTISQSAGNGGNGIHGSSYGNGGSGMFSNAPSTGSIGAYGGYGNYQNQDPNFAKGGDSFGDFGAPGGFGSGGGFGNSLGGDGGFGGGGASKGGNGGFGGGAGIPASTITGDGNPGYGANGQNAAAMGGAIFIRSGEVDIQNVEISNSSALSSGNAKSLGGGIFVLHTTTQTNGNNLGMPTSLANVSICNTTFDNNLATSNINGAPTNDYFDLANRITICPQKQDLMVTVANDDGTGNTENTLSWAVYQSNRIPGDDTITLKSDVQFTGVMKRLISSNMTIKSDAIRRTINGGNQFRPFFIKSGQVIIQDINLEDNKALGGSSQVGGGGAGMGGSVFIYDGNVTINDVNINNSIADSTHNFPNGSGGGGMYGNSLYSSAGGGLFADSTNTIGAYGGYGNYQNLASNFGKGGNSLSGDGENGGFGAGGGKGTDIGGHGGFGGGGGAGGYGGVGSGKQGGDGGFGAGAGSTNFIYGGALGNPGYGSSGYTAAAMGGAIFIRSGTVDLNNISISNSSAISMNNSKSLGGAVFVLHTTTHDNGNNQGMPASLATVNVCNMTFENNAAASTDAIGFKTDNYFDLANQITFCAEDQELIVTKAIDNGIGNIENTLSWAIYQSNRIQGDDVITLKSDVIFTDVMKRLIDSNMTIQSDNVTRTINGNNLYRPLFIKSGTVFLSNFSLTNGLARGGNSDAGAGAGLGGALFIYDGSVSLQNIDISNSVAQGNAGGSSAAGGGGMYGAGDAGGGGLFASSTGLSGGYGGFNRYNSLDATFGRGGNSGYTNQNGGFGGGGGNNGDGNGGFGGGGGGSLNLGGGDGGFGGGSGITILDLAATGDGVAGYGGSQRDSAGFGGAVFIRSGSVDFSKVNINNNSATTTGAGAGLGGGVFILHSTTNSNGNNKGMPNQLASVNACELSFSNNTASDDPNNAQNNDDVFDLSSLMNASSGMPISTQCDSEIEIRGNTQIIEDNDASPRIEDHTDFGLVHNNESITRTFTVHNVGGGNLNLTGSPIVEISGIDAADFSISSQPSNSVVSGYSTSFGVTFNPTSIGTKQAVISIANNDTDENPYNFSITGIKAAPEIDVSFNGLTIEDGDNTPEFTDGTYLGAVAVVSGPITRNYEIRNLGNADLVLTGSPKIEIIGSHASEFTVIQKPSDSLILPNQSITFGIEFDPESAGIRSTTVLIVSNDDDESLYNFDINGLGLAPEIDISGNGFEIINGDNTPSTGDLTNFGSTQVTGGNVTHSFNIFNSGNINLSLETFPYVTISGTDASSFILSKIPQTANIDPNESEPFSIVFDPNSSGVKSAVITVTSNDSDESNYTFNIQGFGQPTLTLSNVNANIDEGDVVMVDAKLDVSTDSDTLVNFVITGEVDTNDFESPLSGQVNIESGQTIAEINLLSIKDNITEGLEIFDITISQPNPNIVSENISLLGSIDDDIIFTNGFEN